MNNGPMPLSFPDKPQFSGIALEAECQKMSTLYFSIMQTGHRGQSLE